MESKYVRDADGTIVGWTNPSGKNGQHKGLGKMMSLLAQKKILEADLVIAKQQNISGRKRLVREIENKIKHVDLKIGYAGDSDSMRAKR